MIYNKREYKAYIRSLFADTTVEEFEKYEQELKDSDKRRKALQKEISSLMQDLRFETDQTTSAILSNKLETLRAERSQIMPSGELAITRFSVLSDGAKKYACTSALLNKYLTLEIAKNNPLKFETKENGDIIIDFEKLKDSHLHELAVDIRDFVHNYMENDKEKVTSANYFLNLYTSVPTIYDLNHSIDKYYDKMKENLNDYTASRQGIEQVMAFPHDKLQLVRMMSSEALDFESDNMGHCIRRDRYVEKINTTAEYYSLRSMEKGKPYYPCATMYFDEGKLVEVVGQSNHAISGIKRVQIIRNYLKERFGLKSDEELMSSDKIPHIDERRFVIAKRNLGFVPDKNGKFYDLYNLPKDQIVEFESCPITAHNLNHIRKENISANKVWLQGNYTPSLVDKLNRFANINELTVAVKFNFNDMEELDLSKLKVKNLCMSSVNFRKIKKITFPENVEKIELWNVDFSNIETLDFSNCKKLKSVALRNSDLRKTSSIKFPPSIDTIDCSYVKASPKTAKRLAQLQRVLKYKRQLKEMFNIKKVLSKKFGRNKD
uniref:Leucine-rich repeat domain-containing protein n=1 Tax=uncultured Alphaproteobacteria bacterium TaxID=91750 RepID=A0A6G8F2Y5_9PROT|nr:hypothetical protein PlAlph_5410 [uncultured Alphaproteobacteria bacterium]